MFSKGKNRINWLLAVSIFLLFFLGFEAAGFQNNIIYIAEDFNLDNTQMGMLASVQYLAIVVFPLFMGHMSDKKGKKIVIIISILIFVAGCMLITVSRTFFLIVVGVFITGGGYAVTECTSNAALIDYKSENGERYLSITQFAFSIGGFISPLICNYAYIKLGIWKFPFICCFIGYMIIVIFIGRIKFPKNGSKENSSTMNVQIPSTVSVSSLIPIAVALFCYIGVEIGVGYFIGSYFSSGLHTSLEISAYSLSIFWLSMSISRFIFGVIKTNPEKVVRACQLCSALALLILIISKNVILSVAMTAVVGFSCGPIWPFLVSIATKRNLQASGTVSGIMTVVSGTGGIVGPLMTGILSDSFGVKYSFILFSVFSIIGYIIMVLVKDR